MSNFSRNGDLPEQNSHLEIESKSNDSDKTVAFLAALQETQNVLNILLQAVLYKDNTESYEANNLLTNGSLESEPEDQEALQRPQPNLNKTRNYLDAISYENKDSSHFLPLDSVPFKRTIPRRGSTIVDLNSVPSPFGNESTVRLNDISITNEREDPAQPLLNNSVHERDTDFILKRQLFSLRNGKFDAEQPSIYGNRKSEILRNAEKTEHNSKTTSNESKGTLPNPSPMLTQNYRDRFGTSTETSQFQKTNSLKEKEGNNPEYCAGSSRNMFLEQPFLTSDADKKHLEARYIPKKERGILNMEEMAKLLQFSTEIYTSCENRVNTLLNRIENNRELVPEIEDEGDTSRNIPEPTVSNQQRELDLSEEPENRRTTSLHLPPESIPHTPSRSEKEMVGDDFARTRTHILCECDQPGVAGGAVPVVTSFTVTQQFCPKDNDKPNESENLDKHQTANTPQKAKPSQIPKLTNLKNADKQNSLGRTEKQRCLVSLENEKEQSPLQLNISSKMLSLQERLKATTSLIREKISNNGEQPEDNKYKAGQTEKHQLRFDEESFDIQRRQKKLRNEFSKNFAKVAQDIGNLKEINDLSAQTAAVDNLFNYITVLKRISNELNNIQNVSDEKICPSQISQDINDRQTSNVESQKIKAKDNKIYIKFLPTKFGIRKRKSCNAEVQTESSKESVSTKVAQSKSETMVKRSNGESIPNNVDSMDGMFIPSFEEPPNMEEEEDEDGLDITITFPEFQQHITHRGSSHLSVCFSDISAEALGRLKRCPKEFTLRMDFVQGKMFFQSGKSPANNFLIGPDLKITECAIDNKMSDIISIKPSTECMYTSQLIPVEGTKRKSSIKTLKSTDSELFNVVSLPTINRKTSGNTKSCITFKNERCFSAGSLLSERRSYRSMPQIPSLTKILEEPALESANTSRAAMMNSEKKPRNRTLPKKKINISLEKLPEA